PLWQVGPHDVLSNHSVKRAAGPHHPPMHDVLHVIEEILPDDLTRGEGVAELRDDSALLVEGPIAVDAASIHEGNTYRLSVAPRNAATGNVPAAGLEVHRDRAAA